MIFFIIIAYERSVLIGYERRTKTFTLFDSHSHDEHGQNFIECIVVSICNFVNVPFSRRIFETH